MWYMEMDINRQTLTIINIIYFKNIFEEHNAKVYELNILLPCLNAEE